MEEQERLEERVDVPKFERSDSVPTPLCTLPLLRAEDAYMNPA